MDIFEKCAGCGVAFIEHRPDGEATYNTLSPSPRVPCFFFEHSARAAAEETPVTFATPHNQQSRELLERLRVVEDDWEECIPG